MSSTTYCILNPTTTYYDNTANCGIKIQMDKTSFREPDVLLFFKGKLCNQHILIEMLGLEVQEGQKISPETIIIKLYKKYGLDYTLQVLDGHFIFILFDYYYTNSISKVYIVRDIYGLLPLYMQTCRNTYIFSFLQTEYSHYVKPGTYLTFDLSSKICAEWTYEGSTTYYTLPHTIFMNQKSPNISYKNLLINCIEKIIEKIALPISSSLPLSNHQTEDYCNLPSKILSRFFTQDPYDQRIYFTSVIENEQATGTINKKWCQTHAFSSKNVFSKITQKNEINIFEFDNQIRNLLFDNELEVFEPTSIHYVFYDKDFISFYFSIPLEIRYHFHNELFTF